MDDDAEITAIAVAYKILAVLDKSGRERALDYLMDRLVSHPTDTAPSAGDDDHG